MTLYYQEIWWMKVNVGLVVINLLFFARIFVRGHTSDME